LSIIQLDIYEELNIFNCQPTGSIKLWPFQCSEHFEKTGENGVQPPEQVTEKHYTGIQAEETEQSLELVQVLSEDLFLGRGTLGWEGAQLPKFLRQICCIPHPGGNGKLF